MVYRYTACVPYQVGSIPGTTLQGDEKRRFGGAFPSSEARARQIDPHKIFEYLAIRKNTQILRDQEKIWIFFICCLTTWITGRYVY